MKFKKHVLKVYRTQDQTASRFNKLRLDKNERISSFEKTFIKQLKQKINSNMLSTYPEIENFYKKLSIKNNLPKNYFLLTFGIDHALKIVIEAFTNQRDKVLILNPTFAMINIYCKLYNLSTNKINYDKNLNLDVKKLKKSISSKIKLIILSNPNSPTGTILKKDDLLSIFKKAKKLNIPVVIDEAYYGFYKVTYLKLIKKFNNIIILRTFSKNFGLAGLRLGFISSGPKLINYLRKFKPMYETNNFALTAASILLDNKHIEKKYVQETEKSKIYFTKILKGKKIKFFKSHANFILFEVKKNKNKITNFFNKKNILISLHSPFKNYIRVTLGPISTMKSFYNLFQKNIQNFL